MSDTPGAPDPPLRESRQGGNLAKEISRTMTGTMKEYFGRGPEFVKTYLMDDLCLVVMRGGMNTVEQTMIEGGEEDLVRAFRQQFQNLMRERLTGTIEQLTGRRVLTYQSQVLFDPHMAIEFFVFDEPSEPEAG